MYICFAISVEQLPSKTMQPVWGIRYLPQSQKEKYTVLSQGKIYAPLRRKKITGRMLITEQYILLWEKMKYIENTANMTSDRKAEWNIITPVCVRVERMQILTRNGRTKNASIYYKKYFWIQNPISHNSLRKSKR